MSRPPRQPRPALPRAFTLLEMLVGMAILTVILLVLLAIINTTGRAWTSAVARSESFQNARAIFEVLTRRLGAATLNTYYQVNYEGGQPTSYQRASDLRFISGTASVTGLPSQVGHAVFFQAPLGYTTNTAYAPLDSLLNVCGFYVDYSRSTLRPAFLDMLLGANSNPYRFRLHQVLQPTDAMMVYKNGASSTSWINDAVSNSARDFAVNIVTLVLVPENPSLTNPLPSGYDYDSHDAANPSYYNQLPPVLEVFMAAIDEVSARKVCATSAAPHLGQDTLFKDPGQLEADIASLDSILSAAPGNAAGNRVPLTHRFFRAKIIIQGAPWSSSNGSS